MSKGVENYTEKESDQLSDRRTNTARNNDNKRED